MLSYFFGGDTNINNDDGTNIDNNIRRTYFRTSPNEKRCAVIDSSADFCTKLFKACLETNEHLTINQINIIASTACKMKYRNPSIRTVNDLKDIATLATHLCKNTTTGRFTIVFLHTIDANSHNVSNTNQLEHLLLLPETTYWVEVYNNQLLTNVEKASIIATKDREVLAMMNLISESESASNIDSQTLFNYFSNKNLCVPKSVFTIGDHRSLSVIDSKTNSKISLFDKCLNGVCIRTERNTNNPFIATKSSMTDTVIVPMIGEEISSYTQNGVIDNQEISRESHITRSQCFDLDSLLNALSTDRLNPITKQPFSKIVEKILMNRYSTEIKLYQRAFNII